MPIVFDYFHHRLHPGSQTEEEAFLTAYLTWDVKPIFHFSSSCREYEDPTAKKEAHADFIYEPINTCGKEVDCAGSQDERKSLATIPGKVCVKEHQPAMDSFQFNCFFSTKSHPEIRMTPAAIVIIF